MAVKLNGAIAATKPSIPLKYILFMVQQRILHFIAVKKDATKTLAFTLLHSSFLGDSISCFEHNTGSIVEARVFPIGPVLQAIFNGLGQNGFISMVEPGNFSLMVKRNRLVLDILGSYFLVTDNYGNFEKRIVGVVFSAKKLKTALFEIKYSKHNWIFMDLCKLDKGYLEENENGLKNCLQICNNDATFIKIRLVYKSQKFKPKYIGKKIKIKKQKKSEAIFLNFIYLGSRSTEECEFFNN
ncbi:hypothetical protein BpHYR1_032735 [Brachionus plicatilis]|uniref:Uncharacterized protein n=1 Tax=Brachionus plicatilis TaxID=10195 RepID=A0A3M7T3B9_BRAPC|nr:hypothetical protein BpHYR1_032735 [Brachionus plicatilis]